jgi:hypothetical protein
MAFGGENESLGVTAHLHNAGAGQGGSLDSTTLINNGRLFALMVAL